MNLFLKLKAPERGASPHGCPSGLSGKRPGFSILELLIVVIVIAVLAAIAFPKYNKAVEETHKKEAKTALNIIRSAEMAFKIDNNEYYDFNVSLDNDTRSTLNIDIYDNEDWRYTVGVTGIDNSTATVTATRARGEHLGNQIFLNVTTGEIQTY